MTTGADRIYNFSSGPCTLPLEVLATIQSELTNYRGTGMGVIEMSHRSKPVVAIFDQAVALMRELLNVPEDFEILFLGGGATSQFGMLPLNLLAGGRSADYIHSGAWAQKAIADAKKVGTVNVLFDGKDSNYMTLPDPASVKASEGATYLHLTSNETIGGLQWQAFPQVAVPLVADMSSDILSRALPMEKFGLIYAGAQKNIGPAGVSVVLIRKDMLALCPNNLVGYLNYPAHAENASMLNTPPVFQVYVIKLVLEWLKGRGGLTWAAAMAEKRSTIVYEAINRNSGFYRCPVDERYRSQMNVVFTLPTEELDNRFAKEAEAAGLSGLKGHRSVGGCRASLYNAMPIEGAEALANFMDTFAANHG